VIVLKDAINTHLLLLSDDTLTRYPHGLGLLNRDRDLDFTILANYLRDHDLAFIFLFLINLDSLLDLKTYMFRNNRILGISE